MADHTAFRILTAHIGRTWILAFLIDARQNHGALRITNTLGTTMGRTTGELRQT